MKHPRIGFIGQGWIGRHYADDFESRGYNVTRYSLEEPYVQNKDSIRFCDIVFIAVPTPTTPRGFDASIVEKALALVGEGQIAVIKSTVLPGTTEEMQDKYPNVYVLNSPEFLVEKTAAYDASHPMRNIVGIPSDTPAYQKRAQEVLSVLPAAPYERIMSSREASLVKYAGNVFLFQKLMFANILYNLVEQDGLHWEVVREAFVSDPRIGGSHTQPVYDNGRGAGGDCFIKDFEAFAQMYAQIVGDPLGTQVLIAMRDMNVKLLRESGKSLDLLRGVYGEAVVRENEPTPL